MKAKEDERLAEDRLADAERAIKADEDNWKKEREGWDKEKVDQTMAKTGDDMPRVMLRPKLLKSKLTWTGSRSS